MTLVALAGCPRVPVVRAPDEPKASAPLSPVPAPPPAPRPTDLVVLLPGESGAATGEVTIQSDAGTVVLDRPLAAAQIDRAGNAAPIAISEEEVRRLFADALAAEPLAPRSFTLYFQIGTTTLTEESRARLAELLAEVRRRPVVEVQVTGHTDRVGKPADNDRLSQERAEALRQRLIELGLPAGEITAVGRGDREPLVPTPDQVPEPRNRRVEAIIR